MELTAFRLMLPEDGTHRELIQRARDAGLPFRFEDGDTVVHMAAEREGDKPALGYTIDLPDADDMWRIGKRIGVCATLAVDGLGFVPDVAPKAVAGLPPGLSDRGKLERLRDVFRATGDAIEALLEATR